MNEEQILPDLQAAVLCEDVRQEMNGMQTLVGVVSIIPTPNLPIGLFKLCLWSRWTGGEGEFEQFSRIIGPDDSTILAESSLRFRLHEMDSHATNVQLFTGVQFRDYGIHHAEVMINGQMKLRFAVPVIRVNPPQQHRPHPEHS